MCARTPFDHQVEGSGNVDAPVVARREEQADREHVGAMQLEVEAVAVRGELLDGLEVARELVVVERFGFDRRHGSVGVDGAWSIFGPPLRGACVRTVAPRACASRCVHTAASPARPASIQSSDAGTARDVSGPTRGTGWRYG